MPARHAPRTKLDGIFRAHLRTNSPICIVRQIGISHSPEQESGDNMETVEISSSSDFAVWAIERAREILTSEGAAFAVAARDMDEEALANTAAALGKPSAMRCWRCLMA